MIKTTRVHYSDERESLESKLNFIVSHGGELLFITSDSYGSGEVGYTIIYNNPELCEEVSE